MKKDFPIYEALDAVKENLRKHNTLILQAPPGAGKSTILPIELLNEDWLAGKKIILLEPRRLAARSVAGRMAELLNEDCGETIGFRIRFENNVSKKTKIEVVTEGILTRMLQNNNGLEEVGLVIFDEFHERSLHADLALALCREVQEILRSDLKILVMSATLEGEKISKALNNCPVVKSLGRQFPVGVSYHDDPSQDYLKDKISRLVKKAASEQNGDLLVFLPGVGEILQVKELLENSLPAFRVFPLYGDLSYQAQKEALLPLKNGQRKVVLSTSIAETSLTIEGITTVVDCGLSRVPRFDTNTGLTKLETVPVTKDTADQRAGRAGRLGPGFCYRMWSEGRNFHLLPERRAEILDADLAGFLLELFNWGIKNISELNWIDVPPNGNVLQANELLENLGAVENNKITSEGKQMASFPAHPRVAHMLLLSGKNASLACDIAALLEEKDPIRNSQSIDLNERVEVLKKFRNKEKTYADTRLLERIEKVAANWRRILKCDLKNEIFQETESGKLLALAYPERIAKREQENKTRYRLANGRAAKIPEHDSLLHNEWIVCAHLDAGKNEGKIFLAAALDVEDVLHLGKENDKVSWDKEREMIVAKKEKTIGNLVVVSKSSENFSAEARLKVICEKIIENGLSFIGWGEEEKNFQNRVLSLKNWNADQDWPDISDKALEQQLELFLEPFLNNIRKKTELQKLDKIEMLKHFIGWELSQQLDTLAPQKISVPSGSGIHLHFFSDGKTPELHVRLQEVFGMQDTPTINNGKTKIVLHLLSPGYKPVQVTQDLKSFWNNAYFEVRKELQRRYPKHSWPENPLVAEAVRGPKKRRS